jgi:hypothetical protein
MRNANLSLETLTGKDHMVKTEEGRRILLKGILKKGCGVNLSRQCCGLLQSSSKLSDVGIKKNAN